MTQTPIKTSEKFDVSLTQNEELITTRQLAEQLGTSPYVVTKNAKKCLPNKMIENGKPTLWNKAEVTVLIEFMKKNNNRTDLDLTHRVVGTSTELTPALRIRNAMMEMQSAYEEELAILRARNIEVESKLTEQQPKVEFFDTAMSAENTLIMSEVAKVLKLKYGGVTLFKKLREKGILQGDNVPYQEYMNRGYFKVTEHTYKTNHGEVLINKTTRVYQKGVDYIRKILKDDIRSEVQQ